MNIIQSISVSDWVSVAVGLFGLLSAWLSRKSQLPAGVRKWLKKFNMDDLLAIYDKVAKYTAMTDADKHKEAVRLLQELSESKLGWKMPDSIAGLIVEYVFQQWKAKMKK